MPSRCQRLQLPVCGLQRGLPVGWPPPEVSRAKTGSTGRARGAELGRRTLARDAVLCGAQAGLQLRAALRKVAQQPQLVLQVSLRGRVVTRCGLPLARARRRAFLYVLFSKMKAPARK